MAHQATTAAEVARQYSGVRNALSTSQQTPRGEELRIEYDGVHCAELLRDLYALGYRVDSVSPYSDYAVLYFTELEFGMGERKHPIPNAEAAIALLDPQFEHAVIQSSNPSVELYVSDTERAFSPVDIDLPPGWEMVRSHHGLGWGFRRQ